METRLLRSMDHADNNFQFPLPYRYAHGRRAVRAKQQNRPPPNKPPPTPHWMKASTTSVYLLIKLLSLCGGGGGSIISIHLLLSEQNCDR